MTSGRRIALLSWLAALAFLLWLYADGLRTWFIADDFAWLALPGQIHSFHDFLRAMFSPQAQGTIRPLSDRGYFLLFHWLFGLESFPMRVWAFATMAANLALVGWLARRVSGGSQVAGFLAPVLWTANSALVSVMYWNSAYNEALCPLLLMAALALFTRFAETGEKKWWWWQLIVFAIGFGVLEINVVYPALAVAWVLFMEPKTARKRLLISLGPLFFISVAYFAIHRAVAPFPQTGFYVPRVDGRIFPTVAHYLKWTVLPQIASQRGYSRRFQAVALAIVGAALGAFVISEIRKRRYGILFPVAWFAIALAPVLVLPDHRTDYYLTIPLIGLAVMAGWGASLATGAGWMARGITAAALGIYLFAMIPSTRFSTHFWYLRSQPVRAMVLGAASAHETHPGKAIVLDGVTTQLYEDAIEDDPFYSVGLTSVYLTPGAEDRIHTHDDTGPLRKAVVEPGAMIHALKFDQAVIYSVVGDHLRNVTEAYWRSAPDRLPDSEPRRVEAGNPLYSWLLGPEWFPLEEGFRWMPKRATVRVGGPRSVSDRLVLEGSCPGEELQSGPVHLSVSVDEIPLPETEINHPETDFRRLYSLPGNLIGRGTVTVRIEVDRVIHADGRDLGLTFGTIAIE